MPLTPEEQARLGEIYAPITFHRHTGTEFSLRLDAPISPAEYVRRSALWSDAFPELPAKESWGQPPIGLPQALPRTPELMPGAIAADADDPDALDRTVLETFLAENPGTWFLDHGGWDEDDETAGLPDVALPAHGRVTQDSRNLVGAYRAVGRRWSLPLAFPELDPHIGWHSVEAFAMPEDTTRLLERLVQQGDPAADHLYQVVSALPRPGWLVLYHLLFPMRMELISRCEYVATLRTLGVGVPPEELSSLNPMFDFDHHLWALQLGGRLGDFVSICMYVPAPTNDGTTPSPLDLADDQFLPPLYVGFGQKAAAIEIDPYRPMTVPMTEIASGAALDLVGNHPKVFVARWTHNTYPTGGVRPRPSDPTRETICEFVDVGAGDEPPIDKKKRRKQARIACLLKMAVLGPVAGAVACLAEVNRDVAAGKPFSSLAEEWLVKAPGEADASLILAPAEQVDAFTPDEGNFPRVRAWGGTPEQRVLDPIFASRRLSWGPPALQDPFRRRQGEPMAQFLGPFISALGRHLEEN